MGARSWNYRGTADTVDATHFFSAVGGWRDSLPCLIGPAEIDFECVLDDAQDPQAVNAPTIIEGRVIDFELDSDGGPVLQISGSAIVTGLEVANPHDDADTYRVTAVIKGKPVWVFSVGAYAVP